MAETKMSEQAAQQVAAEQVVEKKAARRIEDSLQQIGGFNALKSFIPETENLDFKNKAQRNIFLERTTFFRKTQEIG